MDFGTPPFVIVRDFVAFCCYFMVVDDDATSVVLDFVVRLQRPMRSKLLTKTSPFFTEESANQYAQLFIDGRRHLFQGKDLEKTTQSSSMDLQGFSLQENQSGNNKMILVYGDSHVSGLSHVLPKDRFHCVSHPGWSTEQMIHDQALESLLRCGTWECCVFVGGANDADVPLYVTLENLKKLQRIAERCGVPSVVTTYPGFEGSVAPSSRRLLHFAPNPMFHPIAIDKDGNQTEKLESMEELLPETGKWWSSSVLE